MTSLVKGSNEVANIIAPFPTSADLKGLSRFTEVRISFPTEEDMLFILLAEHPFSTKGDIVVTHRGQR